MQTPPSGVTRLRADDPAVGGMVGPRVLLDRDEVCSILHRGALVTIRRAQVRGPALVETTRAIAAAHAAHPRGLVLLAIYRLDPRYPIDRSIDTNLADLV